MSSSTKVLSQMALSSSTSVDETDSSFLNQGIVLDPYDNKCMLAEQPTPSHINSGYKPFALPNESVVFHR